MRQRAMIITVAVFLGIVAVFIVNSYAGRLREEALADVAKTEVLVASEPAPSGLTLDELIDRKLVAVKLVPKEFVGEGALTPKKRLGDKVLTANLAVGEQLTANKFKVPNEAGLSFAMPDDLVAVAIPIDEMKAAGNLVKIGDYVNVIGTIKAADDKEVTRTFLQKVKVLALGTSLENEETTPDKSNSKLAANTNADSRTKTVTLAISQGDAEKLVFMQEEGRIWLTLLPSGASKTVATTGQNVNTIFESGGTQ